MLSQMFAFALTESSSFGESSGSMISFGSLDTDLFKEDTLVWTPVATLTWWTFTGRGRMIELQGGHLNYHYLINNMITYVIIFIF
jgi:hypothetical protein